jgi:hypothetical protein
MYMASLCAVAEAYGVGFGSRTPKDEIYVLVYVISIDKPLKSAIPRNCPSLLNYVVSDGCICHKEVTYKVRRGLVAFGQQSHPQRQC